MFVVGGVADTICDGKIHYEVPFVTLIIFGAPTCSFVHQTIF